MKGAVCLQHVSFESPGIFRRALEAHGYHLKVFVVPVDGLPSDAGEFLLIMGGPMSVNDPDSWLKDELQFVRGALEQGIPVLGICFGAQLLAKAIGGCVQPGPTFEIGMVPVRLTDAGKSDPVFGSMPASFEVFQWHGEGITLPTGRDPLVSSSNFSVQAFRIHDRSYGLLFHLELEESGIRTLCHECPQDLQRSGMTTEKLRTQSFPHLPRLHQMAYRLIDHLIA